MRIVIIGGGSAQWAPVIVGDIAVTDRLQGAHIVLEDIEPKHLDGTLPMARRLLAQAGTGCTVEATTDQRTALDGADFVIVTISTGGLDTMRHDLEIPARYGVAQPVGDTVGPGGIFRALRSAPVVVGIARDMEQVCPKAWLFNYTNPMSALCRAVTKATRIRTVGLCHELYGCLRLVREILGLKTNDRLAWRVAGINHLIFLVELKLDGRDAFPELHRFIREHPDYRRAGLPPDDPFYPFEDRALLKFELFDELGVLPAAGDRHVAEFFPHYLTEETGWGRAYGIELTRITHRMALEQQARARVMRIASGDETVHLAPSQEAASRLIAALANRSPCTDVANLPNKGQIAGLPGGAIVETMATATDGTMVPDPIGELPPAIHDLLDHHIRVQEMTVDAALTGDRDLALEALLLDPLVRDPVSGRRMFDELLAANRPYLPQF